MTLSTGLSQLFGHNSMHMVYDSESFVVVHLLVDADTANPPVIINLADASARATAAQVPLMARNGFEIVDKRSGKEVYLDGSWAELFQQQINAWQINIPTQEEVEDTLNGYAELAHNPVLMH